MGQERSLLSLLAQREFGVTGFAAILSFLVAFGGAKAVTNLCAGIAADRFGRKPILVTGWLVGLPVPLLLMYAPSWGWVVAANVLLGVNQGLTWSTTVIMKVDLVGPRRRGLALGINEAAGYTSVAATAWLTGWIAERAGLRPVPFLVGLAYAVLALGLSTVFVKETIEHARLEQRIVGQGDQADNGRGHVLAVLSQAGLVTNLNDAVAWGLFPLMWAAAGLTTSDIGFLAALYPATWGLGQTITGAWSDRIGRWPLIVSGMLIQAAGLGIMAASNSVVGWAVAAVLLGAGTAFVYPILIAAVAEVAPISRRATAIGRYRFWRDFGFAVGGLAIGLVADSGGLRQAIWTTAAITAMSGLLTWKAVNSKPFARTYRAESR